MNSGDQALVATATRLLSAVRGVDEYLTAVLNETDGPHLTGAQHTAHGLLDRVVCWIRTLRKLDQTVHYQAYLTAARSMIELVVDLILLESEPLLNETLEAWEESAKYKAAKAVVDFAAGGHAVHVSLAEPTVFVAGRRATIDAQRARYWPAASGKKAKHPGRWTGNALIDDVRAVDKLCPPARLEQLHVELYSYSCMVVHGSALAATRNVGGGMGVLPAMGMSLIACGTQALLCAEFTLRILGCFDDNEASRLTDVATAWMSAAQG